jgi:hypothetical protein
MPQPLILYRYFDEAKYADAMVNGFLRISTLERCRVYEDAHQGDANEGTQSYLSGSIKGGSEDTAFVEMAKRSGIRIGPGCSDISIIDCSNHTTIPNAYVLSTTMERNDNLFRESFGQFCVEIAAPALFYQHITSMLSARLLIKNGLTDL